MADDAGKSSPVNEVTTDPAPDAEMDAQKPELEQTAGQEQVENTENTQQETEQTEQKGDERKENHQEEQITQEAEPTEGKKSPEQEPKSEEQQEAVADQQQQQQEEVVEKQPETDQQQQQEKSDLATEQQNDDNQNSNKDGDQSEDQVGKTPPPPPPTDTEAVDKPDEQITREDTTNTLKEGFSTTQASEGQEPRREDEITTETEEEGKEEQKQSEEVIPEAQTEAPSETQTEQQEQQKPLEQTETKEDEKPKTPEAEPEPISQDAVTVEPGVIPDAPKIPSPDRVQSGLSDTPTSNTALNMIWSFGLNRNVPVLNLTDTTRKLIMYACAHVGVLYDFENNRQHILQGHANPLSCTCVSRDKRWLATGDKGKDSMIIIWDTYTGIPVQTIFDTDGVTAMAMTPDARYLATLSASKDQVLSIWDWTIDGETPLCSAQLNPNYGVQNFILFNPEDIHYLVTNSDSQVIFYHWGDQHMEFFAPPLTDQDFNKQIGRFHQSIFQKNSSRSLTATSIGNLVVWDNNKPVTKLIISEPSANKKALKIIKLQDRGINVLTTTEDFIVVGDMAGHVKFFDQSLKLVHWYQDFNLGPVASVSFAYHPDFYNIPLEGTNYPPDATIEARKFVIKDFVVGSSIAIFGNITADGTKVQVIHREHDAAIHAMAAHPSQPYIVIGSYSGLLKIWDYVNKEVLVHRVFDRGNLIRCCTFDPKGTHIAIGFVNGSVRVLDAITLEDELSEPFRYSRDAITHIIFSHDSKYLATADGENTVSVYKRQPGINVDPYVYLGRYRAHYKPVQDIMFGIQLDNNQPRLMSLGMDRVLVEYDLETSSKDDLRINSTDRIEQSAVPQCMAWYPPVTKEHFIVTANDQFKFKLYNATTKMCRKTLLGPTYGSPIKKMIIVPAKETSDKRYLVYITKDKVGLQKLPLDGNPHNAMALAAHPAGIANLVCSYDGKYVFTAGGADATVHMWEINTAALEAQAKLGGDDLIPFYGLLDGGRDGELFAELEDYFYYAQIRSQGVNAMDKREVSIKIPLSEVPFVMRAMGFYPSEQEIDDMLNEVKFSKYVETGQYVQQIDLGDFIRLYINHRPAFGLNPYKLEWAFEKLGMATAEGNAIDRGDLLELLQNKGEHMTEYELAEYLTTLLGYNNEGGSSELHEFDVNTAGDVIDQNLPHHVTAEMFANEVLGFSMYQDVMASQDLS